MPLYVVGVGIASTWQGAWNGRGVPRDETAAAAKYAFACQEYVGLACIDLAMIDAVGPGVPADPAAAAAAAEKGCYTRAQCQNKLRRPKRRATSDRRRQGLAVR